MPTQFRAVRQSRIWWTFAWLCVMPVCLTAADDVITTVAGGGTVGAISDGGLAVDARFYAPLRSIVDAAGNVYFSESNSCRVRRIDALTGVVTTFAGNGTPGTGGIGGPATSANLSWPCGLAFDADGNLYITDRGVRDTTSFSQPHRICRVDHVTGHITVIAGAGPHGFSGDGGLATAATFNFPSGIAVAPTGEIYIADQNNHRVRKFTVGGNISTIAGTGVAGFSGENVDATTAQLNQPNAVALDAAGNVYIADEYNHCIRMIDTAGKIHTAVGIGGSMGFTADGSSPTATKMQQAGDIKVAANGDLYYVDVGNRRVRKVSAGMVTTVAGGGTGPFWGDGGPATAAIMSAFWDVSLATDGTQDLFIAEFGNYRMRRVTRSTGKISTFAGGGGMNDGGTALQAAISQPSDVALDAAGNRYVVDQGFHRIRRIDAGTGVVTTVAGNGQVNYGGDGGNAFQAAIRSPYSLAITTANQLYFSDSGNHRIRKVDLTTGIITTVAGTGISGYDGDGTATSVRLSSPRGLCLDGAGGLYVVDSGTYRLRRLDLTSGALVTIAGDGTNLTTGDAGPAASAGLAGPRDVCVDSTGVVIVCGTTTRRIAAGGARIISSLPIAFAGNGCAVDSLGRLYISDVASDQIARLEVGALSTTWIAGNGVEAFSGDDGPATGASLDTPTGLTLDSAGRLLIADLGNQRVRQVTFAPVVPPPAGGGSSSGGGSSGGGCGLGGAATTMFLLLCSGWSIIQRRRRET